MPQRDFHLHSGKRGAALGIRVIPQAREDEIVEIQKDGTVAIRLQSASKKEELNQALRGFLSKVLEIPTSNVQVVAGLSGPNKLVSLMEIDAQTAQRRLIRNMA